MKMDGKEMVNMLDATIDRRIELVATKVFEKLNEEKQKSKKIKKIHGLFSCKLKLLYATKKYGCSGIEDNSECLSCDFRR